jgi:hypothetical protein
MYGLVACCVDQVEVWGVIGSRRWAMVIVLPVVGLAFLWWAGEQLDDIRSIVGTTFEWPTWRLLGWLVTVMAVGATFSFAARAAGTGVARAHGLATLVVMALPLAIVLYWWVYLSFGWLPALGDRGWPWSPLNIFPTATSCVIVGFLVAGLVASRVRWSR